MEVKKETGGKEKTVELTKETEGKLETVEVKEAELKGRKRKRPCKRELIERTIQGLMKKAAKAQEESDLRFLELEERKLMFDEKILEMENKRWKDDKDREQQQHRKEREVQLKVMRYIL